MRIILVDRHPELVEAWQQATPGTEARCGDIFDEPVDALVSPANSFRFMDGGIDLAYTTKFGWGVQEALQRKIREVADGELLVGQALAIPTGHSEFPTLIAAPTMRVPMDIVDPNAVRLATRAAVRLALQLNAQSLALPGMGTGTGRVKFSWAARMMAAGIADALGPKMFPRTLNIATEDHFKTYQRAS
jgi:O-acetyl-ADP-ribose deacetylase (regulator of RNase III)